MARETRLPMGIENFKEIRKEDYYYVDKTGLIRNLLKTPAKATLFTRPRRFGKTLNMSMLKYFFEIGTDGTLFDGLDISREKELCEKYMGKFPVISISLKGVGGRSFGDARETLRHLIGNEALRFHFLFQSDKLEEFEREAYSSLVQRDDTGLYTMPDALLKDSLRTLSQLLMKHYGQKTIILINEYDVPLDKAYLSGYYDEMVDLIRSLYKYGIACYKKRCKVKAGHR